MGSENFKLAMAFTKKWEGGYSFDKDDPGGETYRGITRKNFPDWEGWHYVDQKNQTSADNLVDVFYKENFWDVMKCDDMPKKVAICVFDTAVNCGTGRTKKWVAELKENEVEERRSRELLQRRLQHYADITKKNPALNKFVKGWANRVNDLSKYIDII